MSAPLYRRRRPAVACIECRRRKVKCDRALPCGPCGNASLLCGYRNPNNGLTSTDPRAAPTATDLPTATTSEKDGTQTGTVSSSPINLIPSSSGSAGLPPLFTFSSRYTFSGDMGMNENEPVDLPGRTVSHAKSLGCGKHYIQSSFGQSEHLNILLRRSDHADIQTLWEQCTHYARIIKSERAIKYYTQLGPPNITNNLLPKSTCDRLVMLYLHTFEAVFRVLHIPTFMQQYEMYWNNPQGASRAFPSTLALVLAIGACFISEAEADELQLLAPKWIAGAQFWLTESFEKLGIDLSVLQVSALLLLARQTVPDPSELVWISGDFPLRIAVGLGLHKETRIHFPEFSPLESEMRKRLWATILEMSIQSSLDTGMPPSISNDDFDSEPPSNIDDVDASNLSAAPEIADGFTQSTIQRMLMHTMPVRLQILRYCNALKKAPGQDYQWVVKLGMQLDAMCHSHTATLQLYQKNTTPDTPKPTEFQIHLLNMLTRRFLLALHSPFALEAKADQSFYFSRKVLTENALACLSPLQLVPQAPLPGDSSPENQQHELLRLKVRGGDIIRHTLCHATAILIVELTAELEENAFPITNSLSQDLFFHAIEASMATFQRRIQAGETSVDIYVLFSCAMAQAKVMKAGLAPQRQTVEPAKDSLNFCCELLRFQAQVSAVSSLGLTQGLHVALDSDLGASNLWDAMGL
ncbi:fungal-specific transcription factor domain-containing protein, partial [Aspergillus granulosus]